MLNSYKWTNTAGHDFKVNKTNVMPIVAVRDPYTWMQSMVGLFFRFVLFCVFGIIFWM